MNRPCSQSPQLAGPYLESPLIELMWRQSNTPSCCLKHASVQTRWLRSCASKRGARVGASYHSLLWHGGVLVIEAYCHPVTNVTVRGISRD